MRTFWIENEEKLPRLFILAQRLLNSQCLWNCLGEYKIDQGSKILSDGESSGLMSFQNIDKDSIYSSKFL